MRAGPVAAAVLAVLVVVGCAGTPSEDVPPDPGGTSATPKHQREAERARPEPAYSSWELGKHVLPRRPDGFGEVRRTPKPLRTRRYPTQDVLPPPPDDRFHATISRIGPRVRERMGDTWTPGCPVPVGDLRYLEVSFHGFDREQHTGEVIVHEDVARDVVGVFRRLHRARYRIESLEIPSTVQLDPRPTGDGNGSGGFACRASRSSSDYSAHAYGLAIDLNPFMNPYRNDDLVLPERASSYLDRDRVRPGMITPDSVVVDAFTDIGWTWGGTFESVEDYMHFSATGR